MFEPLMPQEINEIERLTDRAEADEGVVAIGCRQMRTLLDVYRDYSDGNPEVEELEGKLNTAEEESGEKDDEIEKLVETIEGLRDGKGDLPSSVKMSRAARERIGSTV